MFGFYESTLPTNVTVIVSLYCKFIFQMINMIGMYSTYVTSISF